MTADPRTMRSLLQRADTLQHKAQVLFRDIMDEFGTDGMTNGSTGDNISDAADNAADACETLVAILKRAAASRPTVKPPRGPLSPAQSAILNHLRTVGPIPVTGPYPPGTASNRKSLQVQICKLRRMGYPIACEGWHHGGKYAKPGQYRFLEDAAA